LKLRWMFGLILVLALALALAACGGGDEEEEENGGGGETPAATKTVEADETEEPEETQEPEETAKPSSGGGGASLGDVPIYPGADKLGSYSGDFSYPALVGGDLGDEDYTNVEWGMYETDDSVDDVSDFYKDKMPDKGWDEEGWFDFTFETDVAWGGFTRDDGDSAAWIIIARNEDDDKTEITIGTGSK
jgi:hypothetical protein